jgi:hypothetical protein
VWYAATFGIVGPRYDARMADFSQLAHRVVQATIDATEPREPGTEEPQTSAQVNGRNGGLKGGAARAAKLSPERRSEIARKAAQVRWTKP